MSTAVVTDSTGYLPPELIREAGLTVVPLHVIIDDQEYTEGVDLPMATLAAALRGSARVSTSRPSPTVFLREYERLAGSGATSVVSVHLSGGLSGTCDAALLAARQAPIPVTVVDSESMGMGLGFAARDAASAAAAGAPSAEVARIARERAAGATTTFYVHTLEHLRRGGRIGAASALLGSALAIKPLLRLAGGHIEPVEKQRTVNRALGRLVELSLEAAHRSGGLVDVAVHHLDAEDRALDIRDQIAGRLGESGLLGEALIVELGAVAGAHLGPGTVAVAVSPRLG